MPVDSITSPVNGAVLSEDGNLQLTATASVSGGTITRVEFYHDTTKIGQVTTAPYNLTWYNPDPGNYQLIAQGDRLPGTFCLFFDPHQHPVTQLFLVQYGQYCH